MLSMSTMGGGSGEYYLSLAQEDYYLEGGEPLGRWWGDGAERLGLSEDSVVEKEQFRNLYAGYHPKSGKALVENAGKLDPDDYHCRKPGWDLTFSAPKSVSVLWSQVQDLEVRAEIQTAHSQAVERALTYLQDSAAQVRVGHGGNGRTQCGLAVSLFEHGTSRAQDPQLHSHALIHNLGVTEDGATRSLWSKSLYQHKMAAGAIYRAELAHQLQQRLGVELERGEKNFGFEIAGVAKAVIDHFSTRRKEIEAKLDEMGHHSAKASEVAAVASREKKSHVARSELFPQWKEQGRELGFQVEDVLGREVEAKELANCKDQILRDQESKKLVEEKLTEQRSYFRERDAVRFAAENAATLGLPADDILKTVKDHLRDSEQVVQIDRELVTENLYTTKAMLELEADLLEKLEQSKKETGYGLSDTRVQAAIRWTEEQKQAEALAKWKEEGKKLGPDDERKEKPNFKLNAEQRAAVSHIVGGDTRVAAVTGMAGTGKTTMLEAAKVAWEAKGYEVQGTSLAWTATKNLENEVGIKGQAIAKLLTDVERSQEKFSPAKALEDWKAYVARNVTSD